MLFRVLRIMFAIEVSGCCPGCSGSYLPLGGVRVLCRGAVQGAPDHVCHWGVRVLLGVLSRVLRIMFAIGRCQGGVQGAVQGCCSGCSGSCLPLGGVRVLCRGAVQGAPDHVCHWGVRVLSRVLCRGAVQGAPDHVCHWAVSGCCPGCCPSRALLGCSGSCLPLGGIRVLSRVLCRGAV